MLKRKRSTISPTQRTLAYYRNQGVTVAVTERWNPHARLRQDLFGFCDLIALDAGIVAVQVTSTGVASRVEKIKAEPRAAEWIEAGGRIEVHGWRKLVAYRKDGTKAARPRMALRIVRMTICCGRWVVDETSDANERESNEG